MNTWKPWLGTTSIYFFAHLTLLLLRFGQTWLQVILWLVCSPCFFSGVGRLPRACISHGEGRSASHLLYGRLELEKPWEHVHTSPISHWLRSVLMAIISWQHFQPSAQDKDGAGSWKLAGMHGSIQSTGRGRGRWLWLLIHVSTIVYYQFWSLLI